MKKFDFQTEFKKTIDTKQLVQIYQHETPNEFRVAYILGASLGYMAVAEINDYGILDGVAVLRIEDVETIKLDTIYLGELIKKINMDSIVKQVDEGIKNIKKYSFEGFVSALEGSDTIVEILYENGATLTGRIIGHSDKFLILNEYQNESDRLYARCYIDLEAVARISFDIPYLRIISQSLKDKNL